MPGAPSRKRGLDPTSRLPAWLREERVGGGGEVRPPVKGSEHLFLSKSLMNNINISLHENKVKSESDYAAGG